jgi:hypothetical protein
VLLIASRALLVASIIAAFSPLAVATTPPKKLVCKYEHGDLGLIGIPDGLLVELHEKQRTALIPTTLPADQDQERTSRFDQNGIEIDRNFDFGGTVTMQLVYRINRYNGVITVWEFVRRKSDGQVVSQKTADGTCRLMAQKF